MSDALQLFDAFLKCAVVGDGWMPQSASKTLTTNVSFNARTWSESLRLCVARLGALSSPATAVI